MGLRRQDGNDVLAAGFAVGKSLHRGSQVGDAHWYCSVPQLLGQDLNDLSRAGAGRVREEQMSHTLRPRGGDGLG